MTGAAVSTDSERGVVTEETGSKRASKARTAVRTHGAEWGTTVGALAVVVIVWQVAVSLFHIPAYVLPGPLDVARVAGENRSMLLKNTWVTLFEILVGFGLAIAIGGTGAFIIARSPLLNRLFSPLLTALQIVPKIAIAPLFVVWFGFGVSPKILMALVIAFFPILINTATGFLSESAGMQDLGRIIGLSPWVYFRKIQLPNALPIIFSGLKVALTFAVIGSIVGEFVGASKGLGYIIVLANSNLDTRLVFAAIFVITALGLVLYAAVALLERVCLPWHVSRR